MKTSLPPLERYALGGILALTLLAFGRTPGHDYVNWDDPVLICKNPLFDRVSWATFLQVFSLKSGVVLGNYNPLPLASFALEKMLTGGFDPMVTHSLNLLLHLLTVSLVWRLLRAMRLDVFGALLGTLLFAIHPLRVESVAWAAERKDMLFGCFYVGALLLYARRTQTDNLVRRRKIYLTVIVLSLLALLSKVQAVTLPLSMLLLDWWFGQPFNRRLVTGKWALWLLSIGAGSLNLLTQYQNRTLELPPLENLWYGLAESAGVLWIYLAKVFIPWPLSPFYVRPDQLAWPFLLALPAWIVLTAALWRHRYAERLRPLLFGLAFFLVNIACTLPLLRIGHNYLSDRFTYLPYFGLFMALGAYSSAWLQKRGASLKIALVLAAGLGFGSLTWQQTGVWKNGEMLWTHVIRQEGRKLLEPWLRDPAFQTAYPQAAQAITELSLALAMTNHPANLYERRGQIYRQLADTGKAARYRERLLQQAALDFEAAEKARLKSSKRL